MCGYLAALPASLPRELPEVTRHEREQRRAARAAAAPGAAGLLPQAAGDGKAVRGAVRGDGSQVHLLSVFDVATGTVRAQREVDAKTNEIPELAPAVAHLDLIGQVVTLDALQTQAETARHLVEDKHAHYLMIIKANQPSLLAAAVETLAGPDAAFAAAPGPKRQRTWPPRRRAIRTAPADGISWPHAAQVMRIRRDSGPTRGPWKHKEIAYGITSLPPDLAGPCHLGIYARNHWAIENREHRASEILRRFTPCGRDAGVGEWPAGPGGSGWAADRARCLAGTRRLRDCGGHVRPRRHHR